MHEKVASMYIKKNKLYIYLHVGCVFHSSWMVIDHYLRVRQARVSFVWMKDYSTWNKSTARKENTLLAVWVRWPPSMSMVQVLCTIPTPGKAAWESSSSLKGRKNPLSAQAVNSLGFWNRNLDKSSLYFCKGQSENAIALMHLYFKKAFWASSLNIHFKDHFGWKLGDWLGTQSKSAGGVWAEMVTAKLLRDLRWVWWCFKILIVWVLLQWCFQKSPKLRK